MKAIKRPLRTLRRDYNLKINHKRVYRLMREFHLLARKYNLRAGKYVLEGLNKVFESRTEGLKYRMTVHSDQGVQYQSNIYRHTLRKHRVFQSMSRRATCHDNAAMESFFHIMKVEMNYFTHHFETKKQLVKAMKEWIEYYNHKRIRHKLKGLTPIEYRNHTLSKFI